MSAEFYVWIKALHIIAVISWMAGLLYLPRLFVYHCRSEKGAQQSETFKVMEDRLLKVIMRPAMIATWALGTLLMAIPGLVNWGGDFWIYAKLLLVILLTATHMAFAGYAKSFAEDRNDKPEKFFRLVNELPTVIMIAIVILVIVKPF